MKSVRYLDEARAEFLHEVQYFTAGSPGLGKRFDEAVQKAEAVAHQCHFMRSNAVRAKVSKPAAAPRPRCRS